MENNGSVELSFPVENQITNTVMMICPRDFGFNQQTAQDNEFMKEKTGVTDFEIKKAAVEEFNQSVSLLRSKGVNVVVFDKEECPELSRDITPDQVFPNNWISTDTQGNVYVYPMATPNRKAEANALPYILTLLQSSKKQVNGVIDIRELAALQGEDVNLEGTGCMIFDRNSRKVFTSLSKRIDKDLFVQYGRMSGYEPIYFDANSSNGKPFYHTNIIMCIGETFVACCMESIPEDQREQVREHLLASGKELIELSIEQTEQNFCGNMLHVRSEKNPEQTYIVMSERASKGLSEEQKRKFAKHGEIVPLPINLIEEIGGGSARCMLCEVFLPNIEEETTY